MTKSAYDLISRPIHSCIRRTEIFYTSIVLNNQHFLIRRKPKPIYSDIRAEEAGNQHGSAARPEELSKKLLPVHWYSPTVHLRPSARAGGSAQPALGLKMG